MDSIRKIYTRLTEGLVRARTLPFLIAIQNIIFAILVLIFVNVIISKGKINGELDYPQIKLFYNLIIYILFTLVFLYCPYFLGGAINNLVKSNTVEYLLSARLNVKEIIFATFLRGFSNVLILVISAFPICCVSFYFGGVSIVRAVRIVITLLGFAMLLSSICMYISSCYKEKNMTILISYICSLIMLALHTIFIKYIINVNAITAVYFLIAFIMSCVFVILSFKGKVLDI